nr:MAG TPA: hypothetical protein [Bacteriophage sp.]
MSELSLYDSNLYHSSVPYFLKYTYSLKLPTEIQLKHLVVCILIPKEQVTIFGFVISSLDLSVDTFLDSNDAFGEKFSNLYIASECLNLIVGCERSITHTSLRFSQRALELSFLLQD